MHFLFFKYLVLNCHELECKKELTTPTISFPWLIRWNNFQISVVYYKKINPTKSSLLMLYEHCGSSVAIFQAVSQIHICSMYLFYHWSRLKEELWGHDHCRKQRRKLSATEPSYTTHFNISDYCGTFQDHSNSTGQRKSIFNIPWVRKAPSHGRETRE